MQLKHHQAETPNENRGPGQPGRAYIEFSHESRPPSLVLADFNEFLTSRDFVAYAGLTAQCLEDQFTMQWLSPDQVIVQAGYLQTNPAGYLSVRYSYEGLLQVPDELGPFPECPG